MYLVADVIFVYRVSIHRHRVDAYVIRHYLQSTTCSSIWLRMQGYYYVHPIHIMQEAQLSRYVS